MLNKKIQQKIKKIVNKQIMRLTRGKMVSKSSTFQEGNIRGKRKIWQVMVGEVVYIVKNRFFT